MNRRVKVHARRPGTDRTRAVEARPKKSDRNFGSRLEHTIFLQRTIGNRGIQKLLQEGASPSSVVDGRIQCKLAISQPDDIYEQEADRVAEQVMQMPESEVRRQAAPEDIIQAKEVEGQASESISNIESRIDALGAGGRPLPESSRAFFEPRFGRDFGRVRVHTDAQAAELAGAVNARAFTTGRHIVFGAGQYSPDDTEGKKLLAHELTHVVQQTGE